MNEGTREANEAAFRREILTKLDRIIALLTPVVMIPPRPPELGGTMIPGHPQMWQCSVCGSWVSPNTFHNCTGRATYGVVNSGGLGEGTDCDADR